MDWEEFGAARQLLAELKVGSHLRADQQEEDAGVSASIAALKQADGSR